jgi:hypothetical protein
MNEIITSIAQVPDIYTVQMRLTYVVVHEASASLEISERKQCFSSDSI